MSQLIHWEEGQFLLPHHFQHWNRTMMHDRVIDRALSFAYPYGILEFELSDEDLANRRIHVDRLRAVMPDGTYIDSEANAVIPTYDARNLTGSRQIYLGIPHYHLDRSNTLRAGLSASERIKIRYLLDEVKLFDENTGDNSKSVKCRRINARIVVEGDDMEDLLVMPLFRLTSGTGKNLDRFVRDPNFSGPCLCTSASPEMRNLIRQLSDQADATRNSLSASLAEQLGKSASNEKLKDQLYILMMRLRTLNRFSIRLGIMHRHTIETSTPIEFFSALFEFYAELAALEPRADDEWQKIPDFDHENPLYSIAFLSRRIREKLEDEALPEYIKVDFNRHPDHYSIQFEDSHFVDPEDYFLGIETAISNKDAVELVENIDVFKFVQKSLQGRLRRGVRLQNERNPHPALPSRPNLHYFRIISGSGPTDPWSRMEKEKEAIIEWSGMEQSDFKISIYMTLPT